MTPEFQVSEKHSLENNLWPFIRERHESKQIKYQMNCAGLDIY